MLILTKALKIATEKVLSTIFNIIVFRNVYSFIQMWLSGVYAFIAVIYVMPYVKRAIWVIYSSIRSVCMPKTVSNEKLHSFDKKFLKSTNINLNKDDRSILENKFLDRMQTQSQIDLFSYIFTCASKSALLNLLTIIGVEHVHSNYGYNIVYSIVYCVSITFVICFGASLRYSSILSREWLDILKNATTTKKSSLILITYEREEDGAQGEFVCMWTCSHDGKSKSENVDLKFLSSVYSRNLKELIEFFAEKHLALKDIVSESSSSTSSILSDKEEVVVVKKAGEEVEEKIKSKKYNLFLPDYYDDELVFSKHVKSMGFKSKECWKEFNIFPLIDIKVNAYTNEPDLKTKKKTN
jgi:hypothetical protein